MNADSTKTRTACQLRRLDSPTDPLIGGVLLTTPSGHTLAAHWRQSAPVQDSLALAKDLAARFLSHLIERHNGADVSDVNWPSVVAACQRHVSDWSDVRRAALYAERDAANEAQLN